MPMYEFVCAGCGASFEDICAADAPAPRCPSCGANNTERKISAPSQLKTGAFPYKIGPVHPAANKMARGISSCPSGGACGSCQSNYGS